DKVSAETQFGFSVNTYAVGDLVEIINEVTSHEIDELIREYEQTYELADNVKIDGDKRDSLKEAARIEIGLRKFLVAGNYKGFTDTFEDLHGIVQLPGLAVQRLMAEGFGFAGEGDWKTPALVRACKVMGAGLQGASAFMEDYTYNFNPDSAMVLGSHMLEVDAALAASTPRVEVHPLGIGGKADPARLVFNGISGAALNASLVDMGTRFRLIVNKVEGIPVTNDLPKLPVARVLWKPLPDMKTGCSAWILAGGAHHTAYSLALTPEYLEDFARIAGVEYVVIDENTTLPNLENQLRWNELYYLLKK
ncbi:L-arabinose isomerase, partial [Sphingobacterium shayense]|uniref:L-arabinose isomerase family protein n=1 Tax=Sphingobacterium shayense TaxID=626343 RepID=UPI003CCD9FF4|nr:L-arabinose isomerase [Sphingobacterium shayense]